MRKAADFVSGKATNESGRNFEEEGNEVESVRYDWMASSRGVGKAHSGW